MAVSRSTREARRRISGSGLSTRLEVVDPVVAQGPRQPLPEALREALPLHVQRVQVGVEVLTRAVDLLVGLLLLAGRAVAGQLGEVGEGGEHRQLAAQQLRV